MDATSSVSPAHVAAFAGTMGGRVIARRSSEYEQARKDLAWNGRVPDRYPELIVEARCVDDIVATIAFAQEHRLPISARSGGHSYAVSFLRDGGIALDLSALDEIAVEVDAMRISVGPGATSARIDAALEPHGLAFPVGHGGPVGIAGFLIGGGLGINGAAWGGMSTFNILAADVVLANGHKCRLDANERPDLFWALRGGGPGLPFLVTRFYLRCYPRPPAIISSSYLDGLSSLPRLAALMDELALRVDRRLQLMLAAVPAPPGMAEHCLPQDHGRMAALTAVAFADDRNEARTMQALLAEHPGLGGVMHRTGEDAIGFTDIFVQTDQLLSCRRVRADNIQTDRIEEAAGIILRHLPQSPSPASVSMIVRRGALPTQADAAFSLGGAYTVSTYAQWNEAGEDAGNAAWLHRFHNELESIATGAYVNEFDIEARRDRLALCHPGPAFERLRQIRDTYDPAGIFQRP